MEMECLHGRMEIYRKEVIQMDKKMGMVLSTGMRINIIKDIG